MQQSSRRALPALTSAILLAAMLTACGGGGSSTPAAPAPTPTPAPATTLTLGGSSEQSVTGSTPLTLTATPSDSSTVSWTLGAGNPGALSASSGTSINYLPPAGGVSADTKVTVTATANGASKSFTLTLHPADTPRLSLLAGDDGGYGHLDGTGTEARLEYAVQISTDAGGNLYLADDLPSLRKITPDGVVTTVLSTARAYVDGPKGTASLGQPISPVAGPDGSIYFIDIYGLNNIPGSDVPIRKLALDGSISTIAKVRAGMTPVLTLAADNNTLYVYQLERVDTVSFSGQVAVLSGTVTGGAYPRPAVDGNRTATRFSGIQAVAPDGKGNLYVNDGGQVVRKIAADGSTSTVAGTFGAVSVTRGPADGAGKAASFSQLYNLALTSDGNLVGYDTYATPQKMEYRLRTITPAGVVSSVMTAGDGSVLTGPNNALYVLQNAQIQKLKADGSTVPFVGKMRDAGIGDVDGTGAAARFNYAFNTMGADAAGNLYVADDPSPIDGPLATGLRLRKVTPAGVVSTIAHTADIGYLTGLVVDAAGNTYVSSSQTISPTATQVGSRIFKIAPDGSTTVLAGALPSTDWKDGAGAAAHFFGLSLLGIDADGNLYGYEAYDNKVRYTKITPAGAVTSIILPPATLNVIADASGNTYRIDAAQGVVIRTTPALDTSIIAGTPGKSFTRSGALPGYLDHPSHLVKTGPYSFALFSGGAIMRLTVPH
ncbi:hypothetical protein SAMN05192549_106443 [Duganella sacchari]|uniref:Uncharacterized protein n=1 Tax=Duganella sacchari TaxID=551987 RepID=A0A1M7QAY7_9BURK|nr:hypothetical protein [Duganella sacchari]SHN27799.1 hypothetical protein SAMN05192549_106443 [Duganella sacchari]